LKFIGLRPSLSESRGPSHPSNNYLEVIVSEFDLPVAGVPAPDQIAVETPAEQQVTQSVEPTPSQPPVVEKAVDPARSAAGRLGGKRAHELVELGRKYEAEYGLTPGRQRLRQLAQLGRRYEQEHGLRAKPVKRQRRQSPAEAWEQFLVALARVVKPTHRESVEKLVAALKAEPPAQAA
jgi:hypothetical protein